mgnify:CR=1 FL=1
MVEEAFIAVKQAHEVGVLVEVILQTTNIGQHSLLLLLLSEHHWWKEAMQTHDLTLLQGVCHALSKKIQSLFNDSSQGE